MLALERLVTEGAPIDDVALDARLRAEPLRWAGLVPHLSRRGPAALELAFTWLEAAEGELARAPDLLAATAAVSDADAFAELAGRDASA